MNLRRALFIAAFALASAAGPAAAQFKQPQQAPPCLKDFVVLRDKTAARAKALETARKHHVSVQKACQLLRSFAAAQADMLKYAKTNATWCGIPPRIVKEIEAGHAKAVQLRTKVCQLAAKPPPPRGPTLSDALRAGIPDASNIKRGGGTFDTLTGTPLGRQ